MLSAEGTLLSSFKGELGATVESSLGADVKSSSLVKPSFDLSLLVCKGLLSSSKASESSSPMSSSAKDESTSCAMSIDGKLSFSSESYPLVGSWSGR